MLIKTSDSSYTHTHTHDRESITQCAYLMHKHAELRKVGKHNTSTQTQSLPPLSPLPCLPPPSPPVSTDLTIRAWYEDSVLSPPFCRAGIVLIASFQRLREGMTSSTKMASVTRHKQPYILQIGFKTKGSPYFAIVSINEVTQFGTFSFKKSIINPPNSVPALTFWEKNIYLN